MHGFNLFVSFIIICLVLVELAGDDLKSRPNIFFCTADDWGWPHAEDYGDPVVKTPTFNCLAKEGVFFGRAFVSSPYCTPFRNLIFTGQHFYRLEHPASLRSTLDRSYPNFHFLLRDTGYQIGHWRKAGGKIAKIKVYEDQGHNARQVVYSSKEFYDWMFAKKRE
tara:strand:- start:837 stop:1331 length:495 start_codon:yes stop_codon:yes gene_type:complete